MAALLAARRQNLTAPNGLHACTKAVRLVATAHFGLKGAFGQRMLLCVRFCGPGKQIVYARLGDGSSDCRRTRSAAPPRPRTPRANRHTYRYRRRGSRVRASTALSHSGQRSRLSRAPHLYPGVRLDAASGSYPHTDTARFVWSVFVGPL